MSRELISVIVPVYKVEAYLDRCIKSVLAQTHQNFELILVDDGSPDRCGEICDEWSRRDGRIKVLHKENGGISSARNHALQIVKGEYISFIDSDDYVSCDYLSYLLSLFSHSENCAVTACNHYVLRGGKSSPNSSPHKDISVFSQKEAFEEVLFHGCIDVSGWGKLYRRDVFSKLRFPEGRIYEDTWIFGDILNRTESLVFGKKCCYFYEIRENSITTSHFREESFQYIEAAEKLAADALICDSSLSTAGLRRISHARLSVLRQMKDCPAEFLPRREKLRAEIISAAPLYIRHKKTPQRDRWAIFSLRLGLEFFYRAWGLYTRLRG